MWYEKYAIKLILNKPMKISCFLENNLYIWLFVLEIFVLIN